MSPVLNDQAALIGDSRPLPTVMMHLPGNLEAANNCEKWTAQRGDIDGPELSCMGKPGASPETLGKKPWSHSPATIGTPGRNDGFKSLLIATNCAYFPLTISTQLLRSNPALMVHYLFQVPHTKLGLAV